MYITNTNACTWTFGPEFRPVWEHPLWIGGHESNTGLTVSGFIPDTVSVVPVFGTMWQAIRHMHNEGLDTSYYVSSGRAHLTGCPGVNVCLCGCYYDPQHIEPPCERVFTKDDVRAVKRADVEMALAKVKADEDLGFYPFLLAKAAGEDWIFLTERAFNKALERAVKDDWVIVHASATNIVALHPHEDEALVKDGLACYWTNKRMFKRVRHERGRAKRALRKALTRRGKRYW